MKFTYKSYRSHFSRPKPDIQIDEKNNSLVVCSVWGRPVDTKTVSENILNFYNSKLKDSDYTSPFGILDHLDFHENTLRTALLLAHSSFFRQHNQHELVSGLEICVVVKVQNTLYKAQVGQPHIIRKRGSQFSLLFSEPDLSTEFIHQEKTYAPLPYRLFGTHQNTEVDIRKTHIKKNDQLLFINREQIFPFHIMKNKNLPLSLDQVSDFLVSKNEDLPFWLGLLDL